MKKFQIPLFLGLMLFALSGCTTKQPSPDENPAATTLPSATQGLSEDTGSQSGNEISSGTELLLPTVLPTPTPEGAYVGFSLDSGFYESSQEVSLTCNVADAKIYYTLDGSTPTTKSTLYEKPIFITRKLYTENVLAAQTGVSASNSYVPDFSVDKGTVLRAIAYLPDGTTTPLTHATYFIGLDEEKYAGLPVISLITDFDNLFDYETGIYVLGKTYDDWVAEDSSRAYLEGWQKYGNYSNHGKDWERPVSVELITADGTAGFKQNMGLRIMGGASRNQAQKSLKLYARKDYGEKNLKYALIPDNYNTDGELIEKYKTFVLRVGGNDADSARIRDPYLQTLVKDARFETQQSTPCIAFINGEFWGIYTLNEDYSDSHFENNYGIDKDNVILIKRGEAEEGEEDTALALFHDMYLFIAQNDMSVPEFYEAACELVDMESFIDYFAFELYIHNQDSIFENNNWRMWRVLHADNATAYSDGKWRMAAYDSDYSTGVYSGAAAADTDNISALIAPSSSSDKAYNIKHYVPLELFRSLMQNDTFRNDLILAICDMRNIYFETKHAKAVLDEMAEPYLKLMPETFKRFGPDWIVYSDPAAYYEGKVNDLNSYLNKRYVSMPNILRKAFDLGSASKLSVSTEDASMGSLLVNGRSVALDSRFEGMYFAETNVTITAVPAEGYRFVGWETKSTAVTDTTASTLVLTLDTPVTLKAIFEKQ